MNAVKSARKWVVEGDGDGWVLRKTFPAKWKAEIALRVFQEGGRVSDYWKAAQEESWIRSLKRDSAIDNQLEKAWKEFGGKAEIPPGQIVTVVRHPGEWRSIDIPFSLLEDFQLSSVSGGVGVPSAYPKLYARMFCTDIPEDAEFAHTCEHGPPPHEILVCIIKSLNAGKLYWMLLSQAAG